MAINVGVFPGTSTTQSNPKPVSDTDTEIKYVVEIYRQVPVTQDVYRSTREIELVKPGGTLVNVGAGPQLPANPYEGQVWILT